MTCSKNKECEGLLLASATTQRDASRGTETSAGGQYSSCPLRKQKGGLLPRFLSVFLAFGSIMPLFLKTKFRCLPPLPARRALQGWGQQDQLLHLLRGGRRHLQAPPRREQLRPGERVVLLTPAQ